jgi:drug/metabolite transporter (DMT)-like permease
MAISTNRGAYSALVLAALCSGVSITTTKYALARFTASDLLLVELAVASLAIWAIPRVRRSRRSGFRRGYLLLGLLEPGLAYALFNFGLERTSAADASVLVSLESVVIAVFAAAFLGERLSPSLLLGIGLGVGGAILLAAHEVHRGASLDGDVLVVAGVVAAAGYSVVARRLAPEGDAAVVTAYQLLAALAVAALVWGTSSAGGSAGFTHATALQWVAALATGLLGSAIPFLLFTYAVARLPAARTGLPLNLIPVFGVLFAVALLKERLMTAQLLGGLLVVAGLGTAQLRVSDERTND